jgi:hypothetical protein
MQLNYCRYKENISALMNFFFHYHNNAKQVQNMILSTFYKNIKISVVLASCFLPNFSNAITKTYVLTY